MTLRNYWWLLIWLFVAGGLSFIFSPQQEEIVLGKRCVRWYWFHAAVLAAPYVIWAAWRTNSFGDTGMYRNTFRNMPVGLANFGSYLASRAKDKGFVIFEYFCKTVISRSDIAFFFLVALIQIFCLVYMYRRYSRNYWLSIFFFIASTDYLAWMFNGMRQFIAAAIIFAFTPLIIKKKYIAMAAVVLLASQIHLTALIFLPFIIIVNGRAWNLKTIFFMIAVIASFFFLDRITGFISEAMEDTVYEGEIGTLLTDDGTNIIRVAFYSVPAIMSLVFRKYIDAADDPLINLCVNMSIVAAGFYVFSFFTSGILMGRIPIYFSLANYILIPWLISEVFEPSSAVLMSSVFVGIYSFFFYYQAGVTWGLL